MFRIRAVTPIHVPAQELARRAARYRRLSPAGIDVELVDLGSGVEVPRALETQDAIRASESLVTAAMADTDPGRYDAALPDCVLDPGIDAPTRYPVPVYGLLQLTAHLLAGIGGAFGAVARNAAIAAEIERKLRQYGVADQLRATRVLGLSVGDIADDERWAAAVGDAVADLRVGAVINGCSAVEVLPAGGAAIVDPTATALRMLGLALATGVLPAAGDGTSR